MLNLKTLSVGVLGTNCHLVWSSESGAGIIVDPGADGDVIIREVEAAGFKPAAVLLTHPHVDHIGAVPQIASRYQIPVWLHEDDHAIYSSPDNCLLPWLPLVQDLPEPTGVMPEIPGLNFTVIHTPGHTPGGACFHFAEDDVLLSGDTLFAGSVGRTDFPGGSIEALKSSINEKLFALPGKTVVYPGHGQRTTISIEKMSPFFG